MLKMLFFWMAMLVLTGISYGTQPTLTTTPLSNALVSTNGAPLTINLSRYFNTPTAPNNLVRVYTSLGAFNMQLFPTNAPKTVANFLAYVNDGAYENTVIHRLTSTNDGLVVLQTGGYKADPNLSKIATWGPVTNEYSIPNSIGTVAMAKFPGDPNSATDEWFINILDNSTTLDTNNNGGFAVFAQVIGNGMSNVLDKIAAEPTYVYGNFSEMPLQGVTNGQSQMMLSNLLSVTRVATLPYFALSSDPNSYSSQINGTNLTISYVGGTNPPSNPVTISVIATDTNGLTTNNTFQVWHLTNQVRSIDYPVITNQPYTTNPFYLPYWPSTSDGTSLSGNNISFSGPLGFASDRNAYYTGTGTITFTYVQPGNFFYRGVTNTTSFIISKAPQTITFARFSNPVIFSTNPYTLTNLPVSSSKLPVALSIASNSTGRWRVTNSQLLFTGAGTVTLVANQSGNSNYLAASPVTNTLVVSKGPQTITFPPVNNQILTQINPSPLIPLKAVATSALPVQYRVVGVSNNVTPKGFITNNSFLKVTGIGTVAVEAYLPESSNYLAAAPVTNTVTAKYAQTLRPFDKIPAKTFIYPYASFSIRVPTTDSVLPSSTNVVVTATPTNVATITSNSIVTITGAGTMTLTASQAGDDFYFPASVSTSFVVAKAPQTIAPLPMIPGKSNGIAPFGITVPQSTSGLPVTISASGAGYASTNGTNVTITLSNSGKVSVTATQSGSANYLPAKAVSTTFSVAKGNQSINFPAIGTGYVFGDTFSLQATAVPSGLPVSYRIIGGSNAAQLINGTSINVMAPTGTVTIVASQTNNSGWMNATPVTNSFTIATPQTNSGSQSTGGSIINGGGNSTPYFPPVVTNGPTF